MVDRKSNEGRLKRIVGVGPCRSIFVAPCSFPTPTKNKNKKKREKNQVVKTPSKLSWLLRDEQGIEKDLTIGKSQGQREGEREENWSPL